MSGTDREDKHVPRPREHDLPGGDLAVSSHWVHGTKAATTVTAEDRPLYRLLLDILWDVHVPDTMPARLATECEDLIEVREAVTNIERGRAGIDGCGYGLSFLHAVRNAVDEHRDRDPLRVALMGCSGSKNDVDRPVPARELYSSGYWTVKERYGEAADDWRVLSAEHAVLDPDAEIAYYERTPSDLRGIPVDSDERLPNGDPVRDRLDHWALRVYNGLTRWLGEVADGVDPRDVDLQVCVGEKYRDPLEARGVFDRLRTSADLSVSFPFQEEPEAAGGMGPQMEWMNSEVAATDGGNDRSLHTGTDHDG